MIKTFTCILCPNGCEIETEYEKTEIHSIKGNRCPKGASYVHQELTCPSRTISSSVLVTGGELPLCSVRLTAPVPKESISRVMNEIKKQVLPAPVQIGQTIISNVCGLNSDVIATRTVEKQ